MKRYTGAYAAVLTPRAQDGALDLGAFESQLRLLATTPIKGIAVNGATGEFCITTPEELSTLLDAVQAHPVGAETFCGIGSASLATTLALGHLALEAGATALLLPMPYFFPYRQDDLAAYVLSVAETLRAPLLLYNVPQFTNGLEPETVLELLRSSEYIVGIKDSSGSLDILRAITNARLPATRFMGNDGALAAALTEGICDGVVSGVACTLPELMLSFFETMPESQSFNKASRLLDTFIEHIETLPTPWGLKVTSEVRGLAGGCFPLPVSDRRQQEILALRDWFGEWFRDSFGHSSSSDFADDSVRSDRLSHKEAGIA